jgi:hypothetical protein
MQGPFSCGTVTCESGTQVCHVIYNGQMSEPYAYVCDAMPQPCLSNPSCLCVANTQIYGSNASCSGSDGTLTVSTELP